MSLTLVAEATRPGRGQKTLAHLTVPVHQVLVGNRPEHPIPPWDAGTAPPHHPLLFRNFGKFPVGMDPRGFRYGRNNPGFVA